MNNIINKCKDLFTIIKYNSNNNCELFEFTRDFIKEIIDIKNKIGSKNIKSNNINFNISNLFNIQQNIFNVLQKEINKEFVKVIEILIFIIMTDVDEFIYNNHYS